MLIIWEFDCVKNLVESNQLLNKINDIKLHKTQLSIIIYSTADQLKYVLSYFTYSYYNKISIKSKKNTLVYMFFSPLYYRKTKSKKNGNHSVYVLVYIVCL